MAKQAQIESVATEELVERWWMLTFRERQLGPAEKAAILVGTLEEVADTDVRQAEAALERAAISRELAVRRVDPRATEWRHLRDAALRAVKG